MGWEEGGQLADSFLPGQAAVVERGGWTVRAAADPAGFGAEPAGGGFRQPAGRAFRCQKQNVSPAKAPWTIRSPL